MSLQMADLCVPILIKISKLHAFPHQKPNTKVLMSQVTQFLNSNVLFNYQCLQALSLIEHRELIPRFRESRQLTQVN